MKLVEISKSSWYDKRSRKKDCQRRGPKPKHSDEAVLAILKEYLKEPVFYNEGYKKLKVRLELEKEIVVGKERLRRIMSKAELLLDQANRDRVSPYKHDGEIKTTRSNEMWGTDIKDFRLKFGKMYLFGVIDHCYGNIAGFHICEKKTAGAAVEAMRDAVRNEFGAVSKEICKESSLKIRVDNGSQFSSKTFTKESAYLGLELSFTMVRSPESNGIIERFHRTLIEQIGKLNEADSFEKAKEILRTFIIKFNKSWLYHKNKLRPIPEKRKKENDKPVKEIG